MQASNSITDGIWRQNRTIVALTINLLALAEIVNLTIVAVALPHTIVSI
ncbi:hypothetical protein IDZ49_10390 [Francisella tularensis]|nr:hypothetical protein [Francisella tularensis]MBD2809148.1 hypothetical protein [Francisella tularensis]